MMPNPTGYGATVYGQRRRITCTVFIDRDAVRAHRDAGAGLGRTLIIRIEQVLLACLAGNAARRFGFNLVRSRNLDPGGHCEVVDRRTAVRRCAVVRPADIFIRAVKTSSPALMTGSDSGDAGVRGSMIVGRRVVPYLIRDIVPDGFVHTQGQDIV